MTNRIRILALALAALTAFAAPADSTANLETADLLRMRGILRESIAEMNHRGRVPIDGVVGGMINNAWQTVSHPADPSRLGCGWQSNFLLSKLQAIPGWTFELRYEFGFSSPIFLPHQWITAHGPRGRFVEIDPWEGITEARQ